MSFNDIWFEWVKFQDCPKWAYQDDEVTLFSRDEITYRFVEYKWTYDWLMV